MGFRGFYLGKFRPADEITSPVAFSSACWFDEIWELDWLVIGASISRIKARKFCTRTGLEMNQIFLQTDALGSVIWDSWLGWYSSSRQNLKTRKFHLKTGEIIQSANQPMYTYQNPWFVTQKIPQLPDLTFGWFLMFRNVFFTWFVGKCPWKFRKNWYFCP